MLLTTIYWKTNKFEQLALELYTDAMQNTDASAPSPHENRKGQANTLKEYTNEWGCNKESSQHDTFTGLLCNGVDLIQEIKEEMYMKCDLLYNRNMFGEKKNKYMSSCDRNEHKDN